MHGLNGELDMRKMGGLRHKMPTTHWTFLVATLAISGVPGLSGFFSKDQILANAYLGPLGKPWIFWLATLTAGMTAFYMFRGLFMTVSGAQPVLTTNWNTTRMRGSSKMTMPLVVLAAFSIVAGYVGWPHPLEGLNHFLDCVFAPSESLLRSAFPSSGAGEMSEFTLMGFSMAAATMGILLAWWFYREISRKRLAGSPPGLAVCTNFWSTNITSLMKSTIRLSCGRSAWDQRKKVLWQAIDVGMIDGAMVNGSANETMSVGGVLRRIQSGNLRSYAAWVLLGAVAWLGYILFLH